jgi:hypothetical protein
MDFSKAFDRVRHQLEVSHIESLCFIWFVNKISVYMRVLFYADDMKLFLPVQDFRDCIKIQSDERRPNGAVVMITDC